MVNVKLSESQQQELQNIVEGIARKKGAWFDQEGGAEELAQELWVKSLSIIEAVGEYPGGNLIATSCYNYVTDLYRKKKVRQRSFSVDPATVSDWSKDAHDSDLSEVIISEMRNMFPKGSKQRELFELFELWSGVKDADIRELRATFYSDYMKTELSANLGYASACSGGYRKLVAKVQAAVQDYLDGLRNEELENYRNNRRR